MQLSKNLDACWWISDEIGFPSIRIGLQTASMNLANLGYLLGDHWSKNLCSQYHRLLSDLVCVQRPLDSGTWKVTSSTCILQVDTGGYHYPRSIDSLVSCTDNSLKIHLENGARFFGHRQKTGSIRFRIHRTHTRRLRRQTWGPLSTWTAESTEGTCHGYDGTPRILLW